MTNWLTGFGAFCEADDKFVQLVKHQLPTTVAAFTSMPLTLPAHYKVNGKPLGKPLTLYVCDEDDAGVTLCNVPDNAVPFTGKKWDADGEFDAKPGGPAEPVRLRMSKQEYRNLLTPPAGPPQQPGF